LYTSDTYSPYREVNLRYIDSLIKRNPGLVDAAIRMHQAGEIPPNTYLLDLDAHRKNARAIVSEARKNKVSNYFMSKQIGRNPIICHAVIQEGMDGIVAVEAQEAKSLHRYGIRIGHVGHLVQSPVHDIDYILSMRPEVWTVYSLENAKVVSDRARKTNRTQNLLVQPIGKDDLFFDTMTGGIPEEKLVDAVRRINDFPNVRVVGTTSFPCMMYDVGLKRVRPISNFHTAVRAAKRLQSELGIEITQVNVPAHSHASTMKIIAENGGTHGEPGTGVSGASPWQIFEEQPEIPAFVYVTEVSHRLGDKLYVHGGGMDFPGGGYGIFPDGSVWNTGTDIQMQAMVGSSLSGASSNRLKAKHPGQDPFNYNLTLFPGEHEFPVGDTVVYGFSLPQVFTTRAWHAVVNGIEDNNPVLLGIFDQANNLVDKNGHLLGEKAVVELLSKI